jgi:hypothetical protein
LVRGEVKNNRYFATSVLGKSSTNFPISQGLFCKKIFSKLFYRYQLNLFESKNNRYFVSIITATLPLPIATFSYNGSVYSWSASPCDYVI